jgi:hypothetical protein
MVRSQVAPWLFQRTAHPAVELMPVETDTGVVQIDSLHLASTRAWRRKSSGSAPRTPKR